jgi:hypothetical protein
MLKLVHLFTCLSQGSLCPNGNCGCSSRIATWFFFTEISQQSRHTVLCELSSSLPLLQKVVVYLLHDWWRYFNGEANFCKCGSN